MSEDLLYLIFVFVLILALVAYVFIKDKENSINIKKLESAVEDLNKSIHYIRKDLDEKNYTVDMNSYTKEIKEEINFLLDKEVNSKILPILKSLKGFENVIEEFQNEQENRLTNLEQKTQNMGKLTPSYENEEQKIVDLFQKGKSIEQIAKDLRISTGNVEFTLKLKKLLE
ncbi:hypothetical protein CAV_0194 [Campylobacter avium LMG 24591]|uniref:Periplasmic protein n=1 Tax=Campylobacter avium LMG 24591 TaxID=522484 RepID=A0A222MVZ7_9BACT|nr:hypothetical protein [Campylobacter avium]ASQ29866.1 hypothetical protein CAV_0194 [Campylobacter avium LMG 24591]OYD78965.1 hypothetical protein CAV8706_0196 [Campylobacter avium]HJE66266.1 hypothetical protein [Campylobacter avium]